MSNPHVSIARSLSFCALKRVRFGLPGHQSKGCGCPPVWNEHTRSCRSSPWQLPRLGRWLREPGWILCPWEKNMICLFIVCSNLLGLWDFPMALWLLSKEVVNHQQTPGITRCQNEERLEYDGTYNWESKHQAVQANTSERITPSVMEGFSLKGQPFMVVRSLHLNSPTRHTHQ